MNSPIQWVNALIERARRLHASDIHLLPSPPGVQMRIDGVLQPIDLEGGFLKDHYGQVVGRIKLLAGLNIAESRLPQDGALQSGGVHIRVSSLPVVQGERLVLRVLGGSVQEYTLDSLGMTERLRGQLERALGQPQGMIIVTGPTGSGKTTTLYSCVRALVHRRLSILSAEDPVESPIEGVSQAQVREDIGRGFDVLLRAFLRQDPDVLMVGEIRDLTTALMAVRASMTGHLVLSTLHTNSAAGAVVRLVEMGVQPYLVGASLSLVLAQRLLRRLCSCGGSADCESCLGSGYSGRVPAYESVEMTDSIRHLIAQDIQGEALAEHLHQRPLLDDSARALVDAGQTSLDEYHRVLGT
ncbi:MAG: type II/IV secretion system protein [Gammaproteobacteria bacterium AqS3]|nr:type II/IV secretion system protein [Gammaproteobacteria bacterium AqS3]